MSIKDNPRKSKFVGRNVPMAIRDQQMPVGGRKDVYNLVIKDIRARAKKGKAKYGTRLKTHNGRDAMLDMYQELLDAIIYFRQLLEEKYGE